MCISDLIFRSLAATFLLTLTADSGTPLGDYSGFTREGGTVTLRAGESSLRVAFLAPDLVRVELLPRGEPLEDSSFAVIRSPAHDITVSVQESDSSVTIVSTSLLVRCRKFPLRLAFAPPGGTDFLTEPLDGGEETEGEMRIARFEIGDRDHFYGAGERGAGLDLRGRAIDSYNRQEGGYSTAPEAMNICIPFVASTGGYALLFDNTYRGRLDIGASVKNLMSYTAYGGELTWYLIAAPTLALQLERYTWLTGRQPLPPRWAFGYLQSKNRYRNETEARAVVKKLRAGGFPCDGIVLDLQWFRAMGDIRWDSTAWPDPGRMMADFAAEGIRTILITEPYIVRSSVNFDEALRERYVARDSLGRPYLLGGWWSCGGCDAALLDMTNPAARLWWWSRHPLFMGKYVAGLWTDLGEPERHPPDMRHLLGPAPKVHNIFNLLWARTIFEGMNGFRPGSRVFNLTRSGFAGIQRYGVIPWTGDVSRSFAGLGVQIPLILNLGMSGLPFGNSDIGGYARNPTTPELYVRWMEFGVFSPVARAHGAGESVHGSATEPWQFGPEAGEICRDMIRLRYRLLPYNYTMAHRACETGLPMARPLIMIYPSDARFVDESSSFLWGDDFLVAPVVHEGERTRRVALPEGKWVNFWTDESVRGGSAIDVAAPLARIPLFVKCGSIVPMAPAMEFTDQRPLDTLILSVYPDSGATHASTLYEDDGKTTAYRSGEFSLTRFSQSWVAGEGAVGLEVGIGKAEGVFEGKLRDRRYQIEIHQVTAPPSSVLCNGAALHEIAPGSVLPAHGNGFRFDHGRSLLTVMLSLPADSSASLLVSSRPQ